MKKTLFTLWIALVISATCVAQVSPVGVLNATPNLRYGLQIAPRGGYDILPMPQASDSYLKFKGGPMGGLSLDYYWDWIGAGLDGDYILNKFEYNNDGMLLKSPLTRIFYGVGPNFRFLDPTATYSAELNLRGGMALLNEKGFTDEEGNPATYFPTVITDSKAHVPSGKAQLRFTYFANKLLGFHLGGYYMYHHNVKLSERYYYEKTDIANAKTYANNPQIDQSGSINKSISSIGAFAGVTIRLSPGGVGVAKTPKAPKETKVDDALIKGKVVICNSNTPIEGVTVTVKEKNGAEKILTSNRNGEFSFVVTPNTEITLYGKKSNYFSEVITIPARELKKYENIILEICMERVDCNESVRLENIHYDLDKYNIRPDARPELDRLVQFLRDNPEVKVELSSHTDSRASHEYNQRLSQNRANAARDYVVSKGISSSRIISIGYGETRLLNRCADGVNCSEEEHQLNRRTEMKVICPD